MDNKKLKGLIYRSVAYIEGLLMANMYEKNEYLSIIKPILNNEINDINKFKNNVNYSILNDDLMKVINNLEFYFLFKNETDINKLQDEENLKGFLSCFPENIKRDIVKELERG